MEKRGLLDLLLSNSTLTGASVGYELRKPFAILAEMTKGNDWRARVEEFRTAVIAFTPEARGLREAA